MHTCLRLFRRIFFSSPDSSKHAPAGQSDRDYWISIAVKLADPILTSISTNQLKTSMPYESISSDAKWRSRCFLEAFARLLCGLAPWLELETDDPESALRDKYRALALVGLKNACSPLAPDYLLQGNGVTKEIIVDLAFLCEALLRAKKRLWEPLDEGVKQNLIEEFKRSRAITPWQSNWLLFASMIEAALLEFTGTCDEERLLAGVRKFRNSWYKGDSIYGDGKDFHMDYYNSFVIHPMLTEVLFILEKHGLSDADFLPVQLKRHTRYAEILERFISPEGTYPVVGRSMAYRFGAFHALSLACLLGLLPKDMAPAQVRCALTAVIKKQMQSPENFDPNGWLRVGFTGGQPSLGETYINTGSLYLCSAVMLPLGLPPEHVFWTGESSDWTSKRAWEQKDILADKALQD